MELETEVEVVVMIAGETGIGDIGKVIAVEVLLRHIGGRNGRRTVGTMFIESEEAAA